MATITEDYVSFKTAKLLKEKGFDIPCDYAGVMGVPISFMDVHNPDQFEIVALGATGDSDALFVPTIRYTGLLRYNTDGTTTKAHIACNQCLTLGFDEKPDGIYCKADNTDKYLVVPYKRVLIRRKDGKD